MKIAAPLMLCLLAFITTAQAQPYGGGDRGGRGYDNDRDRGNYGAVDRGNLPGGSWLATCRDVRQRGGSLEAQCADARGRWRGTSIDVDNCASRALGNRDGQLVCEGQRGGGSGLPGGSWRATCRDPRVNGSNMVAECQDARGRWRGTAINLRNCANNRLGNRDGGLVCE